MRTLPLIVATLALLTLVGCSYDPARISPEPLIIIDDDHRDRNDDWHDHDRGDFCPPGQAKKSRC